MNIAAPTIFTESDKVNLDVLLQEIALLPLTIKKRILLELGIKLVKDMIKSQPSEPSCINLVEAFGIESIPDEDKILSTEVMNINTIKVV